jgi:hypothetical protein
MSSTDATASIGLPTPQHNNPVKLHRKCGRTDLSAARHQAILAVFWKMLPLAPKPPEPPKHPMGLVPGKK